jgi:hypothetical protein
VGDAGTVTQPSNGLCLDAFGGSSNPGDVVGTWSCNGGANQRYTLTASGELRVANGLCVAPRGGSASDGALLELQGCTGATAQRWSVGGPTTPPAPTTPSNPTSRFTGQLANGASTGLCLAAGGTGEGNVTALVGCDGAATQRWSVPGAGGSGPVPLASGNACLDAFGGNSNAGDTIGLWGCHGSANQSFTLTAAGELRVASGLCVGPRGGSASPGAGIELQSCTGAASQRWIGTVR